ncbi:MAG: magnesium transporter [Promicromonosporaceae bacterium]|nr:magnesium transporter [Promicromonosporaceae bacterium]
MTPPVEATPGSGAVAALDPRPDHVDPRLLHEFVDDGDFVGAQRWLHGATLPEIVDAIDRMDSVSAVAAFRLLPQDLAFDVFEDLEPAGQQAILDTMRGSEFGEFVDSLDPDDRARMLDDLPAKVARRVLEGLSPRERAMTAALLGYPEESAGRHMTPQVVVLHEHLSVSDALTRVRARGREAETVYTLPVVDAQRRLTGIVELSEVLLAPDEATVKDLVKTQPPYALATDSAESAARMMTDSNVRDLPVVDREGRLLGLLTYDDADEVLEEAESEDAALQGGASHWEGHYMAVSVWQMIRSRAVWLVLLLAVSMLTVQVAAGFEDQIHEVATLALFMPLLIGTGGKIGTQASSACVRALAIGEVRPADIIRVTWREAATGLLLGAALGALAIAAGLIWAPLSVAVVVGVSLLLICILGALVGGISPLAAQKMGIDPALVSGPMVTTVVDVLGLLIYFLVAVALLGL